jgi:hypothetical protein
MEWGDGTNEMILAMKEEGMGGFKLSIESNLSATVLPSLSTIILSSLAFSIASLAACSEKELMATEKVAGQVEVNTAEFEGVASRLKEGENELMVIGSPRYWDFKSLRRCSHVLWGLTFHRL